MSYIRNVKAWGKGFGRFDEISFKPGWSAKSPGWWFLYTLNYGTRVLSGGACVSWSRWFYLHSQNPVAKFITRILNKLDDSHGEQAGPPLWGTEDTPFAKAGAVIFWGLLVFLFVQVLT